MGINEFLGRTGFLSVMDPKKKFGEKNVIFYSYSGTEKPKDKGIEAEERHAPAETMRGKEYKPGESVREGPVTSEELKKIYEQLGYYKGLHDWHREIAYKENIRGYALDVLKHVLKSDLPNEERERILERGIFYGTRAMLSNPSYFDAIRSGADPIEMFERFIGDNPDKMKEYISEAIKDLGGKHG